MQDALVVWLGAMLGTFDDETTTTGVVNSTEVAEGKPSLAFVENLVQNLAGKFISEERTVQSSVMVYLNIYDSDLYRCWFALIVLLIVKRLIAYRIIVRMATQKN